MALLNWQPIVSFAQHGFSYSPCDTPIPYSIGTIDSRFKVSSDELLTDTKIAANVWNATQNKPLFVYDPNSKFTINLVYDSRQALTSQIDRLNSDLKQKQGSIDPKIAAFKQQQADFEKKVADLNSQIQYWNSQGGAPREVYDKLVATQKSLQAEAKDLNAQAQELGQSTEEYNLNAQQLNQTLDSYKQVLQYQPEEGLYEQRGLERKISIYIDISQDEFLHTLTHEMGHALGLDHNNNPESIMFPQTTTVLEPSVDDKTEIDAICKKRNIIDIFRERFSETITILKSRMKFQ